MALRVVIVADDPLARAGLATLITEHTITDQIPAEAITEVIYRAEVAVWDLGWDPTPNLAYLADLVETALPLLALLPDETYALHLWAGGIRNILRRDLSADMLQAGLVATEQGLVTLDPSLIPTLLPERAADVLTPVEELTPREIETLGLLAEGLSNKAIARRLNISEHTVKFHVNAILGKLNARNRTEAVVQATRMGIILL